MTTSIIDADSLLALDIGTNSTRCLLFDVVDGRYRFLASGHAPTTTGAPFFNVGEGARMAINNLEEKTGRRLIGPNEALIMPSRTDSSGIDSVVATMSAGEPIQVIIAGLLEEISLSSARKLAYTTYSRIINEISLAGQRQTSERINLILKARPNLIIVAGGTNKGSTQSVLDLIEAVGLASHLSHESHKPHILYVGNKHIRDRVKVEMEKVQNLHVAPNIRPALGTEDLSPGQHRISSIFKDIRTYQLGGIGEIVSWSGGKLTPTASAFSRIIRFLSKKYDPLKGVLGVDVGSHTTTIAAGFNGEEFLHVKTNRGVGKGAAGILEQSSLEKISRWIPYSLPHEVVSDYIYNKQAYPTSIPVTPESIAIEQALATQALRLSIKEISPEFPYLPNTPSDPQVLPWLEPIIATGNVIARAPNLAQALLILLNGIQPSGITTIAVDQNNLTAALGAAARVNPVLAVQVIETSTYLNLGTIIAPVGYARFGTPILRVRMYQSSGKETSREIKFGSIEVLPVNQGERVKLHLRPLHQFDIGMGSPGKAGEVQVVGGALGIVIDARGRPLHIPSDPERRLNLIQRWLKSLVK